MTLLPLFPLQMVVFPTEKLNLHIFEPRYKQLIREVEHNKTTFGIPAFIDGKVMPIGTELKLVSIEKKYDNGELDIKTIGVGVFMTKEFYMVTPNKLYPGADIKRLKNEAEYSSQSHQEKIRTLYSYLTKGTGVGTYYQGLEKYINIKVKLSNEHFITYKNASNPTIGQLIAAAIHNKRNQPPKSTNSTNFPLKNAISESIPEQCKKMQALVSQIASPSSLTKEELAKKTNEFKNSAIKLGQSIMSEVKQGLFMNDNNKLAHMEKLKKDLECVQPLLDHINKKAPELNKLFEKSGIDLNADSISTKLKDITNQVKQSLSTMITALSRNGSEIGMKL